MPIETACAAELELCQQDAMSCHESCNLDSGYRVVPARGVPEGPHGRRTQTISAHNALLALYASAGGENWTVNTGWSTDSAPCGGGPDWFGVKCDGSDVVSLSFLPPQLEPLVWTGSLSGYKTFSAQVTLFLNTTGNNLVGTLPSELFALDTLTESFMLQYNYKMSGTIPTEAGRLSKLTEFFGIPGARLSGTLPSQIGALTDLTKGFILGFNGLSGSIPQEITNLQKLGTSSAPHSQTGLFQLTYNRFTGPAPNGWPSTVQPLFLCFNRLTWVPPQHTQCEYRVPMCDELYRGPEDAAPGRTAWFCTPLPAPTRPLRAMPDGRLRRAADDEKGQCQRCPEYATRDLILIVVLFIVGVPLAFQGGKMLVDPELAPIASPVISIMVQYQISCQFDDAIVGGMWPPLIQTAFDMYTGRFLEPTRRHSVRL